MSNISLLSQNRSPSLPDEMVMQCLEFFQSPESEVSESHLLGKELSNFRCVSEEGKRIAEKVAVEKFRKICQRLEADSIGFEAKLFRPDFIQSFNEHIANNSIRAFRRLHTESKEESKTEEQKEGSSSQEQPRVARPINQEELTRAKRLLDVLPPREREKALFKLLNDVLINNPQAIQGLQLEKEDVFFFMNRAVVLEGQAQNQRNADGVTKYRGVMNDLLRKYRHFLDQRFLNRDTVLHYCMRKKYFGLFHAILFRMNVRLFQGLSSEVNRDGQNFYHLGTKNSINELFHRTVLTRIDELINRNNLYRLLNATDKYGWSIAHYAASVSNVFVLEGAYRNTSTRGVFEEVTGNGETFVHIAAEHGQLPVIQWASQNLPQYITQRINNDFDGDVTAIAPVHVAASNGQIPILEWFYNTGRIDILKSYDEDDFNIAYWAALNDRTDVLDWIYSKKDLRPMLSAVEDPNSESISGATLATLRSPRVIEWIASKPDLHSVFLQKEVDHSSFLHTAAAHGLLEVFKLVMTNQIFDSHREELFFGVDQEGKNLLHDAAIYDKVEVFMWLSKEFSQFDKLLAQSGFVEGAISRKSFDVLQWLFENRPEVFLGVNLREIANTCDPESKMGLFIERVMKLVAELEPVSHPAKRAKLEETQGS